MVEQKHGVRTATLRDVLRTLAGQETDIDTLVGKTGLSPAAVRNYINTHPGEVEKQGKGGKQQLFIHGHVDGTSFTGPGIRISSAPGFDVGGNDRGVFSSRGKKQWRHRPSE